MKCKRYTLEEKDFLRQNRHFGARFCAEKLGRPMGSISSLFRKMGLPNLTHQERSKIQESVMEKPNEFYKINPEQFYNIQTPEVSYFLGYMWADGYVNRTEDGSYTVRLLILNRDYVKIAKTLKELGKFNVYQYRQSSNNRLVTTSLFSGKPLCVWMLSHDYGTKSFVPPTKILSKIPEHLKHYFWRGYMDGDGSWKVTKRNNHFYFCAGHDYLWDEHIALLNKLGIKHVIVRQKDRQNGGDNSTIRCSDSDGVVKWGNYIYQNYINDGIGLPRKYKRWKECYDKTERRKFLQNFPIEFDKNQPLTKELIYEIVKRYSGTITRERISSHWNVDYWKVRDILRKLIKEGKIDYAEKSISRPCFYVIK